MRSSLNTLKLVALVLTLWCIAAPASAQIYKWVDEDGVVHYSDQPRAKDAVQSEIESKPTDKQAAASALAAAVQLNEEQTERFYEQRDGAEEDSPEAQAARLRKQACDQAKLKQNEYAIARRLYKITETGEKAYLDDAEIDAARIKAQELVDKYCE
ncbi:MAG: DUF4124 domain-containing protein [Pseudomonadota bacterium]